MDICHYEHSIQVNFLELNMQWVERATGACVNLL